MSKNPLDALTEATNRHIRNLSKTLIDNIFQSSPMWYTNEWLIDNDPDDFETFVRETRAAAGIQDPPRQPSCGGGRTPKGIIRETIRFKPLKPEGIHLEDYDLDKDENP